MALAFALGRFASTVLRHACRSRSEPCSATMAAERKRGVSVHAGSAKVMGICTLRATVPPKFAPVILAWMQVATSHGTPQMRSGPTDLAMPSLPISTVATTFPSGTCAGMQVRSAGSRSESALARVSSPEPGASVPMLPTHAEKRSDPSARTSRSGRRVSSGAIALISADEAVAGATGGGSSQAARTRQSRASRTPSNVPYKRKRGASWDAPRFSPVSLPGFRQPVAGFGGELPKMLATLRSFFCFSLSE